MMNKKLKIEWHFVVIPFKEKFAHTSAERSQSETIVVRAGPGLGESCPRAYVTGESFQTAEVFYRTYQAKIENITTLVELKNFISMETAAIDKNPAAWCAVECAFLDCLAREKNLSVEDLLNIKTHEIKNSYTAVIGIDHTFAFFKKALKYRLYGFRDFKIKLSGNLEQDKKALSILSLLGAGKNNVRVDGNNLWKSCDEAIAYLAPLKQYLWAIEEPLQAFDYDSMKVIAEKLNLKIILDESFLNQDSMKDIMGMNSLFIPNVRISKMGGILRTLALVKTLEQQNFQWILGTHVGEMSLLARASLLIIHSQTKNLLAAKEGAFSIHLLKADPFYPNLKFGTGAKIHFSKLESNFFHRPGWNMIYRNPKEQK